MAIHKKDGVGKRLDNDLCTVPIIFQHSTSLLSLQKSLFFEPFNRGWSLQLTRSWKSSTSRRTVPSAFGSAPSGSMSRRIDLLLPLPRRDFFFCRRRRNLLPFAQTVAFIRPLQCHLVGTARVRLGSGKRRRNWTALIQTSVRVLPISRLYKTMQPGSHCRMAHDCRLSHSDATAQVAACRAREFFEDSQRPLSNGAVSRYEHEGTVTSFFLGSILAFSSAVAGHVFMFARSGFPPLRLSKKPNEVRRLFCDVVNYAHFCRFAY